jgi:hypothetical protein
MDIKKFNIIKISLLFLIAGTVIASHGKCPTYKCTNDLTDNSCMVRKTDEQFNDYAYLQTCTNDQRCNVFTNKNAKCYTKTPIPTKLYLGSACTDAAECNSNKCVDGKCESVKDGEACEEGLHGTCNFGNACYKKDGDDVTKCNPLKLQNDACNSDWECQRNLGCHEKKCTPYFSLDDGVAVSQDKDNRAPLPVTLCKTGAEYNGACTTLKRIDTECTETLTCKYETKDGPIDIKENCECGFNNNAQRYCKLGSEDEEYKKHIQKVQKNLTSENCNTMERSKPCNYNLIVKDDKLKTVAKALVSSEIKFENHHKLQSIDDCVMAVVFPDYSDATDDDDDDKKKPKPSCPVYKCQENTKKACAYEDPSISPKVVELDENKCKPDEFCQVTPNPWDAFSKSKDPVEGSCKKKSEQLNKEKRWPGEACDAENTCLQGDCKDGSCPGAKAGEECKQHNDCIVGTFCQLEQGKGTCTKQLGSGEKCTGSYQCQNKYLCFEDKCQAVYFSQKKGAKVPIKNGFPSAYFCEFGTVDDEGVCSEIVHEDKVNDKGMVPCTAGDKCKYIWDNGTTKTKDTKECQCGFNADAQAYCPIGHDAGKNKF